MSLLESKKAQHELYFIIFQVILITTVAFTLFSFVSNVSEDTFIEKQFLSRDLALLLNTINTAPGNIHYIYSLEDATPSFDFILVNQKVTIQELIKETQTSTEFPYAENLLFQLSSSKIEKGVQKIEFENSDYELKIDKKTTKKLNKLKYPYIDTKANIQDKKIAFLSGILKNPSNEEEYEEGNSFLSPIIPSIQSKERIVSTDESIKLMSPNIYIDQEVDLIIAINNNEPKEFKIYIPSNPDVIKQSRKLASLIANKLIENEKFTKVPIIIPIDSSINAPSINIETNNDILKKSRAEILQAISNSINEYYSK